MKFIKKEILVLMIFVSFIFSYIGAAQARTFYYFAEMPGLIGSDCQDLFCGASEDGNVSINIEDGIVLSTDDNSKIVSFSLTTRNGVSPEDVIIKASTVEQNIISKDVIVSGAGVNRNLLIQRQLGGERGDVEVSLLAVVGKVQEDKKPLNVTVASVCSKSIDSEDHKIMCDEDDNYLISSNKDLIHLSKYQGDENLGDNILNGNYKLTNDINFNISFDVTKTYQDINGNVGGNSKTGTYKFLKEISAIITHNGEDWDGDGFVSDNDNSGWEPLGNGSSEFKGVFDGDGFSINNLYSNRSSQYYIGLFGKTKGATVKNLSLNDIYSSGAGVVGTLIGGAYEGTNIVENCFANGNSVSSSYYTGGLIGGFKGAFRAYDSGANVDVDGGTFSAGGFSGIAYGNSIIERVYAKGDISAEQSQIAGLIGRVGSASSDTFIARDVYATGNIYGGNYNSYGNTGGLIGYNSRKTTIENAYATGDVRSSGSQVGGLIGCTYHNGTINNSYSTGYVKGTKLVGGLIGRTHVANIRDSYSTSNVYASSTEVGGFLGNLYRTNVYDSFSVGTVKGGAYTGGFVGAASSGSINNSYSLGSAIGTSYTGGFAGHAGFSNQTVTISKCYSKGDVRAPSSGYIGGFIGYVPYKAIIKNCYSNSYTYGRSVVGGFLGGVNPRMAGTIIENSYSSGEVESVINNAGGFIGYATVRSSYPITISNSYSNWDTAPYSPTDNGGFIAEIHDINNYITLSNENDLCEYVAETPLTSCSDDNVSVIQNAGWDSNIWNLDSTKPTLKNMPNRSNTIGTWDKSKWNFDAGLNPVLIKKTLEE
ncbi:MAG: hypothetical protein OIF36_01960 [Alphaproteobacteria bacterium]|nr:hypothetical protein [Alphaproteobacteria bacterium]